MSFYATLSGSVDFADSDAFYAVLNRLKEGGWVNEDGQFTNEDDEPVDATQHIYEESGVICIPQAHYRNLTWVDFFDHPWTRGCIRMSSTDGVEICWVEGRPSVYIPEMPLSLFADVDLKPTADFDSEEYWDEHRDWMESAESTFHDASYDDILRDAKEHFGSSSLWTPPVDMLEFLQQLETLKRVCSTARKHADTTKSHVDVEHADHLDHLLTTLAMSEKPRISG